MKLMDLSTIRSNLVENKNNTSIFMTQSTNTLPSELPIEPLVIDWENVNNCLEKTFYFSKVQNMKLFVEKLIIKMEKMYHHCRFSVYEYEVHISLTTKTLNGISKQDINLSKYLNEVYFDIES